MSEKYMHRKDVPFSEKVWEKIDQAVTDAAKAELCGRKLLYTEGPYGLGLKALPGRDLPVEEKTVAGTTMLAGCAASVTMIRSGFKLAVRDIAAFEESGMPLDVGAASKAAVVVARQEDALIFNGSKKLELDGLLTVEQTRPIALKSWNNIGTAADDIIKAVTALDNAGFHGPYSLALAPHLYNLLFRRYPQGPVTELEHLKEIVTEGLVKAPAIESGGILLASGQQYASIVMGQDLMTGFVGPVQDGYEFAISETVALRLIQPDAICILKQ